MDITAALTAAGLDRDQIHSRPDDVVRVDRADGDYAFVGEDTDGGWWDWTPESTSQTDGGADLGQVAADVVAWARC